jgi:hypothetical protein
MKMKYIKEYSEYDSKQFTPEDVEELKDVYQDIVDDLGLYDNQLFILKVNDSLFDFGKKEIKIFIRTIVSEWTSTYDLSEPSDEEMDKHNHMLKLLEPHITRIRNMGYIVEVKDMLVGNPPAIPSRGMVINGIEIHITKKPHQ